MRELVLKGMKRRRKEVRFVSVVSFVAVLFLCGIILFQNVMNEYVFRRNQDNYGQWIVSSANEQLSHPYFGTVSSVTAGPQMVTEQGSVQGICLGTAADNFVEIDGSNMLEGRLPKARNEVAVDIVTLAKLGYSYDLGQTITLWYPDEAGMQQEREYILVGTMRCLAEIWKDNSRYPLPSILLQKDELQNYPGDTYTTWFYSLKEEYQDIVASEFVDAFDNSNGTIVYNSYVYENRLWGNVEVYQGVLLFLMVVTALTVGYLLTAYTAKRRQEYYRYRCIGAGKWQVRGIILLECVYAILPSVIPAVLFAYGICFAVCEWIETRYLVEGFYQFDAGLFFTQLGIVFLVLAAAVIAAQLGVNAKSLTQNTGVVSAGKYKKLRRIADRTKYPEKTMFRRHNKIRPVQNVVSRIFTVLVCGILVLCAYEIQSSAANLRFYRDGIDFRYHKENEYMVELKENVKDVNGRQIYEFGLSTTDMYTGAGDDMMQELSQVIGIKDVLGKTEDGFHYFTWEGQEDSKVMAELRKNASIEDAIEYGMLSTYLEESDTLLEFMESRGDMQKLDLAKFEQGEQVVLFVNRYIDRYFDRDSDGVLIPEDTIQAGDMLQIRALGTNEVVVTVEVGAIYYWDAVYNILDFYTSSYKIAASRALAETIAEVEGGDVIYNMVEITYDDAASYQATDKQLAAIAKRYQMSYESFAEERRVQLQQETQNVGIYSTVFAMIAVVYVTLQRSFLAGKNRYWRQQFVLLKQIGMEDKQYLWLSVKEELKSFLWVFSGIISGAAMILYRKYTEYKGMKLGANHKIFSTMLNDWTADIRQLLLEYALYKIEYHWYLLVLAVLYLILVVGSVSVIKSCMKKEKS